MVLRNSLGPTILGTTVGIGAALWVSGLLGHFLYSVKTWDPLTYGGAALLALIVGTLAAYVPARRAAVVQPAEALRAE